MRNTKRSITFKVLLGYLLIVGLVIGAFYFIYPEIKNFLKPRKEERVTNKKLTFTSNALSYLYEAETIGRTAMATGSQQQFKAYKIAIGNISRELDSLGAITNKNEQVVQIDSIEILLKNKTQNIQAMVDLRQEQNSRSYYDEAINELSKEDIYFEDYENDPRLDSVDPYTKKVIVDWLNYIRDDNASTQDLGTMAQTVRETLAKIEERKRKLEKNIIAQENQLLSNDRTINIKIRELLSTLERENNQGLAERQKELTAQLDDISDALRIAGILCLALMLGFVILIFRDVSKSQRYNQSLEKSNKRAQSLLKSREQLMTTITHDMRSPLHTLMGFTDLLQKTSVNDTQKKYLNNVEKSGEYMLTLVNDLLDFSKLEAGHIKIENVPFNPENLIEDVLATALPSQLKPELSIKTAIETQAESYFLSDPFRIKQILTNLITNAYKFTDEGHIKITVKTENNTLQFAVEDTGTGIAREKQHLIFKEFAQAEDSIEKKYGGFGLGLAISQKLAKLLQGKISLESKLGTGSTFTLKIPAKKTSETKPLKQEKSEVTSITLAKKKVLIVDDEEAQLMLLGAFLSKLDIDFLKAKNGKQALEIITKNNIDLVLTDIQMPVMDGVSLQKEIQRSEKQIPVVALSGNEAMSVDDYKDLGFLKSLKKPYDQQDLQEILEEILQIEKKAIAHQNAENSNEAYSLNEIKQFLGEDPESIAPVITAFIESSKSNLADLRKAIAKRDIKNVNRVAHKMLPMCRQLQTSEIISILDKMEKPEFEKSSGVVWDSLFKILKNKFEELLPKLEQEIKH